MNDLAIVICNYNKREFVLGCIKSVFQSDYLDFDVFVVDNASTDGSAEAIQNEFGERLTLLINEMNTGGSGGFNRGMREVMARNAYKYVILLDNDTTLENNAIRELRSYMDQHPEVGICGAAIFQMNKPEIIQEMGALISLDEFTNKPLYRQLTADVLPLFVECDYVPFCAAIIRIDAIQKVGLMESRYFIYWDDMEFCWRVRNAGYKIRAISSAIVYHNMSWSKPETSFIFYYFFRNKTNCFARHTNDFEFALLPEIITKRFYRSMICNQDNSPVTSTYMYALDDALNGVMGKADDYKIVPLCTERKWHALVKGKSNILIHYDPVFVKIDVLLSQLRELCNAKLTVVTYGVDLSHFNSADAIFVTEKTPDTQYDLEIIVCYHVLDLPFESISFTEGKTLIYDNYENNIADRDDFLVFQNYEKNYAVFRNMLYPFVKEKLRIIRERYHAEAFDHNPRL